uniref:GntR family transcriptional regulator n=1 Tax=Phytohabitans aurantiacus TaxID=3016789 RepID=UPI00389AD600
MSTSSPELFVKLDRSRPRGLRAQLERSLRDAIRAGRLRPGVRLPSSRALAADLQVTRGVVIAAYHQLIAEGYSPRSPGRRPVPTRGLGPRHPHGDAVPARPVTRLQRPGRSPSSTRNAGRLPGPGPGWVL